MRRRDLRLPMALKKRKLAAERPGRTNTEAIELAPSLFEWTGYLLHRVQGVAQTLYASAVARIRLRPNQVGILQLLAAEGSMVQARLGEKMGLDKATIVLSINELEEQQLVRRKNHVEDGRAFIVELTVDGKKRLAVAERLNAEINAKLLAPLSRVEREELHRMLRLVAEFHLSHERNSRPDELPAPSARKRASVPKESA